VGDPEEHVELCRSQPVMAKGILRSQLLGNRKATHHRNLLGVE
jgi:hypothetical protein